MEPDEENLLNQAALAARKMVKNWVRRTLRETAVSALQKHLKLHHNATTLELHPNCWEDAATMCDAVASKWAARLEDDANLLHVAQWVREVASDEREGLYFCHQSEEETGDTTTTTTAPQQNDSPMQEQPTEDPSMRPTAWATLRTLGDNLPANLSSEERNKAMTEELDRLGESNQSYWMGDWNVIRNAALEIPKRLHGSVKTPPTSDSRNAVLDRKRKSSNKKSFNKLPKRLRTNDALDTNHDESESTDPPRPPDAGDGTARFLWQEDIRNGFAPCEAQKLDSCLHNDESTQNSIEPMPVLLGALQDVGRSHFFRQLQPDQIDLSTMSDKQRRRLQKEMVGIRLGDHVQIRDERTRARMSRVVRTVDKADQYWMDIDMGHCMLQANGTLFAFHSVELLLKDEDQK